MANDKALAQLQAMVDHVKGIESNLALLKNGIANISMQLNTSGLAQAETESKGNPTTPAKTEGYVQRVDNGKVAQDSRLSDTIATFKGEQYKANVSAIVDEVSEPKQAGNYTNQRLMVHDNSGSIELLLWEEDCKKDALNNSVVTIENGAVKAYKGKLSLGRGKFGKISWS